MAHSTDDTVKIYWTTDEIKEEPVSGSMTKDLPLYLRMADIVRDEGLTLKFRLAASHKMEEIVGGKYTIMRKMEESDPQARVDYHAKALGSVPGKEKG